MSTRERCPIDPSEEARRQLGKLLADGERHHRTLLEAEPRGPCYEAASYMMALLFIVREMCAQRGFTPLDGEEKRTLQ